MKWWILLGILSLIIFLAMYCYKRWWKERPTEGFQVTTYVPTTDWNNYTISGTSYTIFDPEALYIQAKMFRLTLGGAYIRIKAKELDAMNKLIITLQEKRFWKEWKDGTGTQKNDDKLRYMTIYAYEIFTTSGMDSTCSQPYLYPHGACSDECPYLVEDPLIKTPIDAITNIKNAYDRLRLARVILYYYNEIYKRQIAIQYRDRYHTGSGNVGPSDSRYKYAALPASAFTGLQSTLDSMDSVYTMINHLDTNFLTFSTFLTDLASNNFSKWLNYTSLDNKVREYLNNMISSFDAEVIHQNIETNPIGKLLSQINTKIHTPIQSSSGPYQYPPRCSNIGYHIYTDIADIIRKGDPPADPTGFNKNEQNNGAILTDDNGNIFIPNSLSLTDNSARNVLLNPSEWRLVDLAPPTATLNGKATANTIRDEFLQKKGLSMANQTNILTRTIQVKGTMNNTNMDEIRRSVFYSTHFNFSDQTSIKKQIRYSIESPFALYMCKTADFEEDSIINTETFLYNDSYYTHYLKIKNRYNINKSVEITQDIINILPYHLRDTIRVWGVTRRQGILRNLTNEISTDTTAIRTEKGIIKAAITSDIIANSYNANPTINLFDSKYQQEKSFIQTSEAIQITLANLNQQSLSIKIIKNIYFDGTYNSNILNMDTSLYEIKDLPVKVKKIRDRDGYDRWFTGKIIGFTKIDNFKGNLILDTRGGIYIDPFPQTFVNSSPTSNDYIIEMAIPPKRGITDTSISPTERRDIMNALAQCFYDSNSLNTDPANPNKGIRITTILDIYQVGNTIFDARFRVSERNPTETTNLLANISTLQQQHNEYRNLALSADERNNLETNYNQQYLDLIYKLQKAVEGTYDPSCGVPAQYIRINCDEDISLSQIEVVDYTGQNVAVGSKITYGIYNSLDSNIYSYEDPTGSVIGPKTDSVSDAQYNDTNTKYVDMLKQSIKAKHINCIVDGVMTPRYEPDIYEITKGTSDNYLEIDLGYETNICYVRLIFPKGRTIDRTKYSISLKSAVQSDINTIPSYSNIGNDYAALFTDSTNCPTPSGVRYNPYCLGRFYADIKTSPQAGYLQVNNSYIKFTGYSGGQVGTPEADAVFTFNPMYNGGFKLKLQSASGNINFQPIVRLSSTRETDLPNIDCQRDAAKIMYDYMANITHPDFLARNSSYYDTNTYIYYVSSITHWANDSTPIKNAKACRFRWKELEVNKQTNIKTEKNRVGKFIYIRNLYDWKLSADYYDVSESFILPADSSTTYTPFSPQIQLPVPTIAEVFLDPLNDRCANKRCSDLDVIDSIIQGYNTKNTDTILRVSKAVTPGPTQCEFECYTNSSSATSKKIRMDIDVGFDSTAWKCTYTYKNSQIVNETTGTYIQSNTPMLIQVYNYTTEIMRTFKQSVNDIYTNLSTIVQPHISGDGMKSAVTNYRKDTWGAFGEINGTKCNSPELIYSFLSMYRNFSTRVSAIKGIGTFNSNTCDYMVDETTMSISGGIFVESAPVSAIYRATIDGYVVTAKENITGQNTASQILLVNRSSVDHIDLSGVIRSNHISFGDILSFAVTTAPPAWVQGKTSTFLGTPVFIESASSYLEANIQSVSATSIIFYNFFNPRGDFNKYVSATGSTITGEVPDWFTNGIRVQIFSDPAGTLVYNGTININATKTITQPVLTATTNYNIFLYDTYTISNATPTQPSTAGSWTTPITLGTGLYAGPSTLQVEAGSTSYTSGQPFQLVNKFFNTAATFSEKIVTATATPPSWLIAGTAIIISTKTGGIQIYDGSIFGVSGNQITLSTFPSMEAYLSNPSDSYNIYLTNDTAVIIGTIQSYSGTNLILNITSGSLLAGTSYTIQQTARPTSYPAIPRAFSPIDWIDCSSEFAQKSTNQTGLTQTGINTCGKGATSYTFTRPTGSDTLINGPASGLSANTCTTTIGRTNKLINSIGYSIAENESLVSGTTYEYRITSLDTLPFDQTYKRITFYGNCQISAIQGADIVTSPNKIGNPGTNATNYANFFRHWLNITYYYGSKIQNKKVIGNITGYFYDTTTDGIIFQCKSAEFGQNGPADILKYNESTSSFPTYAYYKVVFRRKYGQTGAPTINSQNIITSVDNISSNYMIYSAVAVGASASTTAITSLAVNTAAYTSMPNKDTLNYIAQEPSAALTTNQFRFLRFRVSEVNQTNTLQYAEITRIYFYKANENKFENGNGNGLFLQNARFRMSDISSNYYNYQNTDCSGGYLKIPNPYKTSYNICAVATRKDTSTQSKYEYPKTGTCSIGYVDYNDSYQKTYTGVGDAPYKTNTNACITTSSYGEVNTMLVITNSSTKRLRLNLNQYLLIDLGDLLTIDSYTFVTGSASRLPKSFQLEGSYNGITWKILNTQTGFTYPTQSTFYVPGYFPITGGAPQALTAQPSFYTSQTGITTFEGFENPVVKSPLLEPFVDKTPYFKPDETILAPRYALPLVNTTPMNMLYQPLNTQARRIKTMKFHVLETHDPDAKFVHMSMFQFHTSAGPMKSSMVRISNPMGSRRSPSDSPESLFESTTKARWVDYNKMPLIFTFIEYPQAQIIGFQFAFPDTSNHMAALPSRWKMEGSYDGRNWEIYHEKTEKAHYIGNASPIYKFKTEI
jgi:hypothetical protein